MSLFKKTALNSVKNSIRKFMPGVQVNSEPELPCRDRRWIASYGERLISKFCIFKLRRGTRVYATYETAARYPARIKVNVSVSIYQDRRHRHPIQTSYSELIYNPPGAIGSPQYYPPREVSIYLCGTNEITFHSVAVDEVKFSICSLEPRQLCETSTRYIEFRPGNIDLSKRFAYQ